MKIFSLQTKKHLAGWSVVVAVLLNQLMKIIMLPPKGFVICGWNPNAGGIQSCGGWPFLKQIDGPIDLRNILFWILISLIILSLIRYFRYRSRKDAVKTTP